MQRFLIIETKLFPNSSGAPVLARHRLTRRLLHFTPRTRLVMICGEAGSGKSCLLDHYAAEDSPRPAWYSLHESDRDPLVFLYYLLEAFHRACPGVSDEARERLGQDMPSGENWQPALAALVNTLTRRCESLTVVLDDFHLVDDVPRVLDILAFLIEHVPPGIRFVVATRRRLPFPLAYLRSKGALVEIDGSELRFTVDEAEQVFALAWNVSLPRDLVEALVERTEGWITGLQLVAQSLAGRDSAEMRRYVERLGGKDDYIFDYLATQVYARQDADVRSFLKQTSIAGRFDESLAGVLTGCPDCPGMIRRLHDARLFLVHEDSHGSWYRYHHLFSEFLRRMLLLEDGPEAVSQLHRKACHWFEARPDILSAVSHALSGDNREDACRLVEAHGPEMLAQGLHDSVRDWLIALGPAALQDRPALAALAGDVQQMRGDWAGAVEAYNRALALLRKRTCPALVARVTESLVWCHLRYGHTGRAIEACAAALEECPPEDLAQQAGLRSWLGAALVYTGRDWDGGYDLIRKSHALATESGDPRAISHAGISYGFAYHFVQGRFQEAEEAFGECIHLCRSLGWAPLQQQLQMNLAVVLLFAGQVERARALVEDARVLAERSGNTFVLHGLQLCRAMELLLVGDVRACSELLSSLSSDGVPVQLRAWYYRTLMLARAEKGSLPLALEAASQMLRFLDSSGYGMYAPECFCALGWTRRLGGDVEGAEQALQEALVLARTARSSYWTMKAHAMLGLVLLETERAEEAREHLLSAWRICGDHGYGAAWASWEGSWASRGLGKALSLGSRDRRSAEPLVPERPSASHRVEIVTLGRFEVLVDGEPVHWSRRLVPRLLKFLLARYPGSASRDALLEAFWSSLPPDRARRNLIANVDHLRRAVHPDRERRTSFVTAGPGGYGLRVDDVFVRLDLEEFDRLYAEGTAFHRQGAIDLAKARLMRAEAMCRGRFLPDDLYDDWLSGRREQVDRQYRDVVHLLGEQARESGLPQEAATWYRRQILRDPADESTFRCLLQCHMEVGDRTVAKRDYASFRKAFSEEFDAEPSPETEALMGRVLGRA